MEEETEVVSGAVEAVAALEGGLPMVPDSVVDQPAGVPEPAAAVATLGRAAVRVVEVDVLQELLGRVGGETTL